MMKESENNQLVKGALLLTLAGLISKLLSAGYRIPLQNLTGDMGFYVYQQVYPFLGIALMLALYGFPAAISKMTAEMGDQGKGLSLRNFYIPVFLLLVIICGSVCLFLFFNADNLAVWVGDPDLTLTYKLVAFIFLLIPFSALMRGMFQGRQLMQPTAYSQIGEQLTRVTLIIAAAVWIYLNQANIYTIGQAAAAAAFAGAVSAIVILLFFFRRYQPAAEGRFIIPWQYYVRTLFILGIAAALNHMVLIIIQFADTFTLIPSLQAYGLDKDEAMKAKGVFDRGQPLVQFGTVLGSSFALALIPVISAEKLKQRPAALTRSIRSAILISFYLAAGATVGLISIFPETNRLLFLDEDGTGPLRILAVSVFLSSIGITAASILQGLGYMKRTAVFIGATFFLKWIANQMLVPFWGIGGSAVATVLSLAVFTCLTVMQLRQKLPVLHLGKHMNWSAFVLSAAGMVSFLAAADYVTGTITSRTGLLVYVMCTAIMGAIIYLILLLRLKAFKEEELFMLPFAGVLIRIHKARDH
ncbi:low temperature requirement protein B [Lentibacillus amyloliquefaciens]|uniref:Low temperature requirement protein B n=2 Tax=Lentibacillus amyloliquefaciens TaxID=1472767 RepID=A0A0U4FCR0_9BACI|nr:low temperature requirement protein B [Lentibacillus amyloliquefaciens]